jgi:hypothetical protein
MHTHERSDIYPAIYSVGGDGRDVHAAQKTTTVTTTLPLKTAKSVYTTTDRHSAPVITAVPSAIRDA